MDCWTQPLFVIVLRLIEPACDVAVVHRKRRFVQRPAAAAKSGPERFGIVTKDLVLPQLRGNHALHVKPDEIGRPASRHGDVGVPSQLSVHCECLERAVRLAKYACEPEQGAGADRRISVPRRRTEGLHRALVTLFEFVRFSSLKQLRRGLGQAPAQAEHEQMATVSRERRPIRGLRHLLEQRLQLLIERRDDQVGRPRDACTLEHAILVGDSALLGDDGPAHVDESDSWRDGQQHEQHEKPAQRAQRLPQS
jgi:hypothetical protein